MWPMMDMFNLLVLVGVAMAAFQRFFVRPPRLTLNMDAWIILGLLTLLMVSDILVNSFEIDLTESERRNGVPRLRRRGGLGRDGDVPEHRRGAAHDLLVRAPARLPRSSSATCRTPSTRTCSRSSRRCSRGGSSRRACSRRSPTWRSRRQARLRRRQAQQFTWKQLLDCYSCTECGRCTAACPANLTGKLLSPKHVIHDIRLLMEERSQSPALDARTARRRATPNRRTSSRASASSRSGTA